MSSENPLIIMKDLREAKLCSSGARAFFKRHDLNWKRFLEHGICATELSHIEDAMVQRVIEVARGRIEKANNRL